MWREALWLYSISFSIIWILKIRLYFFHMWLISFSSTSEGRGIRVLLQPPLPGSAATDCWGQSWHDLPWGSAKGAPNCPSPTTHYPNCPSPIQASHSWIHRMRVPETWNVTEPKPSPFIMTCKRLSQDTIKPLSTHFQGQEATAFPGSSFHTQTLWTVRSQSCMLSQTPSACSPSYQPYPSLQSSLKDTQVRQELANS